jgi:hypothetical protein
MVKSVQGIHEVLRRAHSHSGEQMPTVNQVLASLLSGFLGVRRDFRQTQDAGAVAEGGWAMVPQPLVEVVAVRAVGGYLRELAYPHGQVRLLDAESLPSPRAYDAVRADHAAFAYVISSPLADSGLGVVKGGALHSLLNRLERRAGHRGVAARGRGLRAEVLPADR